MKFIDDEHRQFYKRKLNEIGRLDVYYRALIYTLSICPITRENFDNIFNAKDGEININSINAPLSNRDKSKSNESSILIVE